MTNPGHHKNFLPKYWSYLLGIFGFSFLAAEIYYVVAENQDQLTVINQEEAGQKKRLVKTTEVVPDPVIDNVYWSIASFIVYGLIYLWLRQTDYKKQAFFIIQSSIILGKLGLVTFSSYYYQKNNFEKNFNRAFNPIYFCHQDGFKITISLIGYLGLAAFIYYDSQEPVLSLPQPQPQLPSQPDNNIFLNDKLFTTLMNSFLTDGPYSSKINFLKTKKIFDLKQLIAPIRKAIALGKIKHDGVENLVGYYNTAIGRVTYEDCYYYKYRYYKYPILNNFFACLDFFFHEENEQNQIANMANNFLKKLTADNLDDNQISSLQEMIYELFYFLNCIRGLHDHLFGEGVFLKNKSAFKTVGEINQQHLKFLQNLVKKAHLENFFSQQVPNMTVDKCQDIEIFHWFLMNNKNRIAISENDFLNCQPSFFGGFI